MAVIFPFEREPYKQLGIDVSYVGHPLTNLDTSFEHIKKKINKDSFTVGFFPGSRMNEIKRLSPIFNEVISNLNSTNLNFFISASSKSFEKYFKNYKNCEVIYDENIYDSINRCDIAVAASGTITLQIALCEKPLCVVYKLSWLSYLFAKFLVKLKNISLVNIVGDKSIIKEFIQQDVTSVNISKEITRMVEDDQYRSTICEELKEIKEILKKDNGENIVDIIFQMIE